MHDTGVYRLDEIIPNRSTGYTRVCKKQTCQWKNNNFEAPFIGTAAGGSYSTIEDLFRFSQALHHEKLLNSQFTHRILSTEIKSPSSGLLFKIREVDEVDIPEKISPYGFAGSWNKYGLAVWKDPLLVGHTGGITGSSAFFATSPDGAYTIIILSNTDGPEPILLYKNIRKIVGFSDKIYNY
jgi:CubicO group peptidase (beta-lactamase class C family)